VLDTQNMLRSMIVDTDKTTRNCIQIVSE